MTVFLDTLYFSYGSNLNVRQMLRRCPAAEPYRGLSLKNWRMRFKRVADIERAEGHEVIGGLWNVTRECEIALDRYEGVAAGLYRKVQFQTGGRTAFMYLMNGGAIAPPPRYYYDSILEGFTDWGFDVGPLRLALIEAYAVSNRENYLAYPLPTDELIPTTWWADTPELSYA